MVWQKYSLQLQGPNPRFRGSPSHHTRSPDCAWAAVYAPRALGQLPVPKLGLNSYEFRPSFGTTQIKHRRPSITNQRARRGLPEAQSAGLGAQSCLCTPWSRLRQRNLVRDRSLPRQLPDSTLPEFCRIAQHFAEGCCHGILHANTLAHAPTLAYLSI